MMMQGYFFYDTAMIVIDFSYDQNGTNDEDDRSKLTWKRRFSSITTDIYNFYSSGDEVFELYNKTPWPHTGGNRTSKGRYSCHKQESYKGRAANVDLAWAATDWSGWGFEQIILWIPGSGTVDKINKFSAQEANLLSLSELKTNTVFYLYPSSMDSPAISRLQLDEHLAKVIPALSPAVGNTNLGIPTLVEIDLNNNANHEYPNGWWRTDNRTYATRWMHSDIKDAAYYFVFSVFHNVLEMGGLK